MPENGSIEKLLELESDTVISRVLTREEEYALFSECSKRREEYNRAVLGSKYALDVFCSLLESLPMMKRGFLTGRKREAKGNPKLAKKIRAIERESVEDIVSTVLEMNLSQEAINLAFREQKAVTEKTEENKQRLETTQTLYEAYIKVRNTLVRHNTGLVRYIAKEVLGEKNQNFNDLIKEGEEALIRAVDKFDHTRGLKFGTYATTVIKRDIETSLNDYYGAEIIIPRYLFSLRNKISSAEEKLLNSGRKLDDLEISEKTGISLQKIAEVRKAFLLKHRPDDDLFNDLENKCEPNVEFSDVLRLPVFRKALAYLKPEEIEIILLKHVDELGLNKIAELRGVTRQGAHYLERTAKYKLAIALLQNTEKGELAEYAQEFLKSFKGIKVVVRQPEKVPVETIAKIAVFPYMLNQPDRERMYAGLISYAGEVKCSYINDGNVAYKNVEKAVNWFNKALKEMLEELEDYSKPETCHAGSQTMTARHQ